MARNTADACMFCTQNPCKCGKPARPAKAAPRRTTQATPAPSRVEATLDGAPSEVGSSTVGTSAVGPAATPSVQGRPNLASVERVRDQDAEALAYAITCFAEKDMLHRDTLEEYRHLIRLPDSKIRSMIWKQDNADSVQRQ
jgi:hypothetical protein